MKILKIMMMIAVTLMGGTAITSCHHEEDTDALINPSNTASESQNGVQEEHSDNSTQVLDSINGIKVQIETLSKDIENTKGEFSDLSNRLDETKGSTNLSILIAWITAALALIAAVVAILKLYAIQKQADLTIDEIDVLRRKVSTFEQNLNSASSQKRPAYHGAREEYDSLNSRVADVERYVYNLTQYLNQQQQNTAQNTGQTGSRGRETEQTGYFGLPVKKSPTQAYFKEISDVTDHNTWFTVTVVNGIAKFKPVHDPKNISDMRSVDEIKPALEIRGEIPTHPTHMKVIKPGEAKKEGDRWFITQKAIIELS